MEYFLTKDQEMIKELARQIARERVLPVRAELDEKEEFPWEIMRLLAQSGLFGVYLPEQYGGTGGGCLDLCIATEELSKVCGGVAVSYAASALGSIPILLFGSEEQKRKYLPSVASGQKLAAFALTEPNAGSDAAAVQTSAMKKGETYVLNGTKQ